LGREQIKDSTEFNKTHKKFPGTACVCSHWANTYTVLLISGVAVGSGWQSTVAYINIGCYYIIGIPMGVLLGWLFNLGVLVRNRNRISLARGWRPPPGRPVA